MSERLVIIGGSAMGRELYAYARDCGMIVKGFLDSRSDILGAFDGYPPVLDSVETYKIEDDDVFVSAVGDPRAKMEYVNCIAEKGGRFTTIIHPTAYVGMNVKLGNGCIICPHVSITNDTIVGDHVIVNNGTSINHDNVIGTGSTISPGCHLAGRVRLGENVFLGVGALVIPDVELGNGVYVAAGAVVVNSAESGCLMGVPARPK